MTSSPKPLSLFESLPAELHDQIFEYLVGTTEGSHEFSFSSLSVSKTYFVRAKHSYYRHASVPMSGTRAGLAHLKRIPTIFKRRIRRITFTGGDIELEVLRAVVAQCPNLNHLELKELKSEFAKNGWEDLLIDITVSANLEELWKIMSHLPCLTVSKAHSRLRFYIQIRVALRQHPKWNIYQWGKIGHEVGLWDGLSGVEDPDAWLPCFEVMRLLSEDALAMEGDGVRNINLWLLERHAQDIVRAAKIDIQQDGEMKPKEDWSEEDMIGYCSAVGKLLCGDYGALAEYGGIKVDGQWTFP